MIRKATRLDRLTTLGVGGPTEFFEICSEADVRRAHEQLNRNHERWYVLGGGSNVLASDDGFSGVILLVRIPGIEYRKEGDSRVLVRVGAGVLWDTLVEDTAQKGLWGLENLAGIPGTVGAAPVQNIGAYGVEVKDTVSRIEAIDMRTGEVTVFSNDECEFAYRDSFFKRNSHYVITYVEFILSNLYAPKILYKDIVLALEQQEIELTPASIANLVRDIRNKKFPDLKKEGTAGSFFKNPIVTISFYEELLTQYPGVPSYPMNSGFVKVPLAYILDVLLNLRGFTKYGVRCFERQPLVLVASKGVTAKDIEMFAQEIEKKVFDATKIIIEREVQLLK